MKKTRSLDQGTVTMEVGEAVEEVGCEGAEAVMEAGIGMATTDPTKAREN